MGTLFTALGAAAALAGTDIIPVHQGGARAVGLTGAQLLTYVGTTYVPLAGGTMTGALTIASGTLTASAPALNVTQTWDNAAINFDGVLVSITNSASGASSRIQSWYYNSTEYITFDKAGGIYALVGPVYGVNLKASASGSLAIGSDVLLYRDAAATLAQRNGTTQQIFRLYNSYTDSSNFERLTLTGVAGTSVNITAETLGTGGDNLDIVITTAGSSALRIKPGGTETYVMSAGAMYITGTGVPIQLTGTGYLAWGAGAIPSASDTGIRRGSAGLVEIDTGTSGAYRDLKLRNLIQTAYHEVAEMTAPAAPATNSVRIYAEDNGAGKTRLMALFATGAAQQLAIEP